MDRAIAEHSLFRPKPSKPETKDDITDHAARAIIGNKAALREAKTARLRQARLENEAKLAAGPASAKAADAPMESVLSLQLFVFASDFSRNRRLLSGPML